ncbi:hypothetical protein JW851_04960 [Candidatus Woesearchaeota archaeon]|nr:hypothetical protein [Candidatus Woesearchaeota archaeon]
MKKIFSLLIMAMFVLSLASVAFAGKDANRADTPTSNKYAVGGDREGFLEQAQEQRTELLEKRGEALEKRQRQRIDVAAKRTELLRKFQENKAEMQEVVQKAVQRRTQAIAKYQEAKAELAKSKQKLQKCKGKDDVTCTEERKNARENSHKFLLSAADRALGLLEKTKERIQNSKMSEEEKAAAIAGLEASMEELASVRQTVEETTDAATTEEIKESAKMVRETWKKANKEIKEKATKVASEKFGGTLVKIERLQSKLERTIEQLQKQGKDTSSIEAIMEEFNAKIEEANQEHATVQEKLQAGQVNEATRNMVQAHKKIKEAHMLLKDVVRKIRKAQQGQEISEGLEPETEAEEAAAEEAEEAEEVAAEAAEEVEEETEEKTETEEQETEVEEQEEQESTEQEPAE